MATKSKSSGDGEKTQVQERLDRALKRSLEMPPKPHKKTARPPAKKKRKTKD